MTTTRLLGVLTFTLAGCKLGLPPPAPRPSYAAYCAIAAEVASARASRRLPAAYGLLSIGAAGLALSPLLAARLDDEVIGVSSAMVAAAAAGGGALLWSAARDDAAAAGGFAECVGVDDDGIALAVARAVYQRWTGDMDAAELLQEIARLTATQPASDIAPMPPPEPPPDDTPEILEAATTPEPGS